MADTIDATTIFRHRVRPDSYNQIIQTFAEYPYPWFTVTRYRWRDDRGLELPETVCEIEDEYGDKYTVNHATIARGINRLGKADGILKDLPDRAKWFRRFYRQCGDHGDGFDFDVADADSIVQAAIYDDLVYG